MWDDFEDEITEGSRPGGRQVCGIRRLLGELPPEAVDVVLAAVNNRNLSGGAVSKALRKRIGANAPSQQVINTHRRGNCSCDRKAER